MKKFLRKIPGGIFGPQNEATIFSIIKMTDTAEQLKAVHRLMTSLPTYSQHLLVLLFGTFRVIAANSVVNETNMTAQALGVRYVFSSVNDKPLQGTAPPPFYLELCFKLMLKHLKAISYKLFLMF